MTRSSGISSGAADSVVVESSHSFRPHSIPASTWWFPATRRGWKSCCCSWSPGKGRRIVGIARNRRQALRVDSGLLKGEGHGGSVGPLPWPGDAASIRLVSSSFLFRVVSCSLAVSLHLVFGKFNASMPCNSPARFTFLCYCETAAVS